MTQEELEAALVTLQERITKLPHDGLPLDMLGILNALSSAEQGAKRKNALEVITGLLSATAGLLTELESSRAS